MTVSQRYTTRDLPVFTDDGGRHEVLDGELYVSSAAHYNHQRVYGRLYSRMDRWSEQTNAGEAILTPGVIFSNETGVIPDLIWVSNARRAQTFDPDGRIYGAPELVVECLSPGWSNENRDRMQKLAVYSRYNVSEYWIVDWRAKTIEVYRRESETHPLVKTITLHETDTLQTPLLPAFEVALAPIFAGM